jgi:hypothetical protein
LWKQSAHAKLLQRPPAQKISPKHAALLQDTTREILHLMTATNKAAAAYIDGRKHSSDHPRLRYLDSLLLARPVATLCQLLVWLQQGIAVLQLPELAAELGSLAEDRAAAATAGSASSSSSSNSNSMAAAEVAAVSAAGGRGSGAEAYGKLWWLCTSGVLAQA